MSTAATSPIADLASARSDAAPNPIAAFNLHLMRAKLAALQHLHDLITDSDAPPRERRLAATAILRCAHLPPAAPTGDARGPSQISRLPRSQSPQLLGCQSPPPSPPVSARSPDVPDSPDHAESSDPSIIRSPPPIDPRSVPPHLRDRMAALEAQRARDIAAIRAPLEAVRATLAPLSAASRRRLQQPSRGQSPTSTNHVHPP